MCVKMYYFNTKTYGEKTTTFNQSVFVIELLSFKVKSILTYALSK